MYEVVKRIIAVLKSCSSMSGFRTTKDILTQLANVLPTGTFMLFQLIAPLATNNGHCGKTEKIVTGVLLAVFAVIIVVSCFTDSVKVPSTGKVYYGLVTTKGLWNLSFQGSGIPGVSGAYYTAGGSKYTLRVFDFVTAALSLSAFATLSLLTDPVSGCYWKQLSSTVVKTVPLIVGVAVSFVMTFGPSARNGFGFKVDASVPAKSAPRTSLLGTPAISTSSV